MDVFCSDDQTAVLAYAPTAAPRVLPLPTVPDSQVVVLLHLLLQEQPRRPVELDATGLRRLCPIAALLLASALRARGDHGAPVQITHLGFELRRSLEQHPLRPFCAGPARSLRGAESAGIAS
jgi:hypothetical protein